MRDLRRPPRDLLLLWRREDAGLAPAQVEHEVDRRVHVGVERRTGALEDSGQADRDLLARPDRRAVGHAVEAEPEGAARPLAAHLVPVLLAAQRDAALATRERMPSDAERLRRDHQVLDDEPLLELEEIRASPRDFEAPVLKLERPPIELVALLVGLELEIALRFDVALWQDEDAVVVRPEELGAVDRKRARKTAAR